ncbi:polyprenyl synthetase family protein [Clostridia bacterium]|nr:polyprenyl synthetase family protein [Clostridia bacterium]
MDINGLITERKELFDSWLKAAIPEVDPKVEILGSAMEHSLLAGGKRLRPILLLETMKMLGADLHQGRNVALAIEMIHTFTLIHDDLPCMDDDDFRRGIPTCHKVFGEDIAVLAGDALVFAAFSLICRDDDGIPAATKIAVMQDIAEAVGPKGVIGGQVLDILSEEKQPSEDVLSYIHTHKTADLIRVAVLCGARLAGANIRTMEYLERYAIHLGLSFQITDDILDVEGVEEILGKPVGSDLALGKMTYPALLGLEAAKERAKHEMDMARAELENLDGCDTSFFIGLCDFILHRLY